MNKAEKKKIFDYIWKKRGCEKNLKGERVILYLTDKGTSFTTLEKASDKLMEKLKRLYHYPGKKNPARKRKVTKKKTTIRKKKATVKKKWSIQSVIFLKSKWTRPKAAKWLRDHGYKAVKPDGDGEYWRYRQSAPGNFSKFRTFPFGGKGLGIKAIYGDVKKGKKINPAGKDIDEYAATELKLYVENDPDLYRRQYIPIIKNLVKEKVTGKYDSKRAVKAFMHLMESGAKKYNKELGSGNWYDVFTVPTRESAAREFVKNFEVEYSLGNFDQYIPKKYQKKTNKKTKNVSKLKIAKQKRKAGKRKASGLQIPNFVAVLGRATDIEWIGGSTGLRKGKKHFLIRDDIMLACNVSGKKLFMFPKNIKTARVIKMSKRGQDARKMFKKWAGFASGHEMMIAVPDVLKWILMGYIRRIDYVCSREGKAYYHPFEKKVRIYCADKGNVYKIEPVKVTGRGIEDP